MSAHYDMTEVRRIISALRRLMDSEPDPNRRAALRWAHNNLINESGKIADWAEQLRMDDMHFNSAGVIDWLPDDFDYDESE